MDFLSKTLGSFTGSSFPYTTGEKVLDAQDPEFPGIWNVHNGTVKADNSPCTVFVFNISPTNSSRLPLARNMLTKLKTVKLPGVIKYLDSSENDSAITIVTERVTPLSQVAKDLTPDTVYWGLHSIGALLNLFHESTGSIHANINLNTVFITESGEWTLGGFELFSKIGEAHIQSYGRSLPSSSKYAPPEILKTDWQSVSNLKPPIDSWQLGVLSFEVFNGPTVKPSAETGAKQKVPNNLWTGVRGLLASNPRQRSKVSSFLANTNVISNSELVKISNALPSLKIDGETSFFDFLALTREYGDRFPKPYLHNKVVPLLVECFEIGKGGIQLLTLIIKLSKDMEVKHFNTIVAPIIVKQFSTNDRAIRVELLQSLPDYIEYLDKRIVSEKIYPPLATGFSDTEPALREQTVRAVFSISPKLTDRILNGDLLRQLAKVQNDSQKEIRANTTILLGKIAPLFTQNTRTAVLVVAFGRALKDPFIESRLASLRALDACDEYFGIQDVCGKILGTLAPALVDNEKKVRDEAFKTFGKYFDKVKSHSLELDEKHKERVIDGETPSRVESPAAGGWSNWASSLSINLGNGSNIGSNATPVTASSSSAPSRTVTPSVFDPSVSKPSASTAGGIRKIPLPTAFGSVNSREADFVEPDIVDDAWGDDGVDAWGNDQFDDEAQDEEPEEDGWGAFDDGFGSVSKSRPSAPPISTVRSSNTSTVSNLSNSMKKSSISRSVSNTTPSQPKHVLSLKSSQAMKKQSFASTFGKSALGGSQSQQDEAEDAWGDDWGN